MKVLPFKIPKPGLEALVYQEDYELVFYSQLHQHEDVQISYIAKGSGTLLVADSVAIFAPGSLFVIGSNVPHMFKSDEPALEPSLMKSLFFKRDSFGKDFFKLEETAELASFFQRSRMGMQVLEHEEAIIDLFNKMRRSSKLDRFLGLIQILKFITQGDTKLLSTGSSDHSFSHAEGQRLRKVFEYTMTHYQSSIGLDQIAAVANMTRNAFCKYFKKRTNKTYGQFLNELRVEMVIKTMYANPEMNISQIAYDCGFGSISNFNKTFKKINGISPRDYSNS